ncbi:MAG TPA: hypothetical protein VID27_20150, partial [Blastocatellia bacterium]
SRERRLRLRNSFVARATPTSALARPCAKAHGYNQVAADAANKNTKTPSRENMNRTPTSSQPCHSS